MNHGPLAPLLLLAALALSACGAAPYPGGSAEGTIIADLEPLPPADDLTRP